MAKLFSGLRFGKCVLGEKVSKGKWSFRCDCGKVGTIWDKFVKERRDCGCSKSLVGKTFGRWKVLSRSDDRWKCKCNCGREKVVRGACLKNGESKSCGCLQREKAKELGVNLVVDLVGKKFGRITVVKRVASVDVGAFWYCECECGVKKKISSNSLRTGKVRSCGCWRSELARARMFNPELSDEERERSRNDERTCEWRMAVYRRDGFTCQKCGDNKGGNLNAHHKDSYHWCKEKRFDVSNGVATCGICHGEFHKIFGFRNNTDRQWCDFVCGVLPKSPIKVVYKEYSLVGGKFGLLEVERRVGTAIDGDVLWECVCDCGSRTIHRSGGLRRGSVKSCGCRRGIKNAAG